MNTMVGQVNGAYRQLRKEDWHIKGFEISYPTLWAAPWYPSGTPSPHVAVSDLRVLV